MPKLYPRNLALETLAFKIKQKYHPEQEKKRTKESVPRDASGNRRVSIENDESFLAKSPIASRSSGGGKITMENSRFN